MDLQTKGLTPCALIPCVTQCVTQCVMGSCGSRDWRATGAGQGLGVKA